MDQPTQELHLGRQAPVDDEHMTGDEARFLRSKKANHRCHVGRLAEAAGRRPPHDLSQLLGIKSV
jgi:hypothetical protein